MADERVTLLNGKPLRLAGKEVKVGEKAPDFDVVDSSLKRVRLSDTGSGVRIFSVIPSLDTPVCDAQTKRFQEEAVNLPQVKFYNVSMDLPFAQSRWCGSFGVDRVVMLSDHVSGSFGENYGTLIPDLRIESRAIFVIDSQNVVRYVEYVDAVGNHPNYDGVLAAAREIAQVTTSA